MLGGDGDVVAMGTFFDFGLVCSEHIRKRLPYFPKRPLDKGGQGDKKRKTFLGLGHSGYYLVGAEASITCTCSM